ncbi:MgtC family protein [Lactobacillus selangorensis]|uniref:MgtC family protein n=1 Tax=Lactobacillus selangorensis TaxID=81857 RepID=A0A0R2FJG0_9LACO|nr:MgtC/SapB family protein [Lactobacillus selangorensis]KRN28801.1 MgtC family protein [Lactobacillus selangorensis]KRN32789.1 MgtC family protein [Lactobacillus selangorensis]
MTYRLSLAEICIRLVLAITISGFIGYDREHKNRPAGIKTHMLVCVGACVIALIQKEIGFNALNTAIAHPNLSGVLRADDARLIAQVVSGIGFLGAGTIVVQHHNIRGLTTAASLWSVACVELAIGMGNYLIATASAIAVFLILVVVKKLIRVTPMKRIEVQYHHKLETKEFIQQYFDDHGIIVNDVNFRVTQTDNVNLYVNIYEIEIPRIMNYADIIEEISLNKNIMEIQTVSL